MSMHRLAIAAAGLAAVLSLAACGRQGALERPTPLSGQAAQPPATERAGAARRALADAAAANADPRPPQSIEEVRDLASGRKGRGAPDTADPSAPRPPGSPPAAEIPASSAPQ